MREAEAQTAGHRGVVSEPEHFVLEPNGWMPNNERLPVLLYRGALHSDHGGPARNASAARASRADPGAEAAASRAEDLFTRNGWPPQWRNGVYTFHHYHSTAHEVLGFVAGEARLVLGGEGGREITVRKGDVLVLPAGTGHCELSASQDLLVVGAYPPEQHWDICRTAPDEKVRERMRVLPFPDTDPVSGTGGALARFWRA